MATESPIKRCSICHCEKSAACFYKRSDRKSGYQSQCIDCNLAKYRISRRNSSAKDRVKNPARVTTWKAGNKPAVAAYERKRRLNNPAKLKLEKAVYRNANRVTIRSKNSDYKKAFPELSRTHYQNRRARKLKAGGTHTATDRKEIRALQGDLCNYCRANLLGRGHLDHMTPLARGGSNGRENLQFLCAPCNQRKGTMTHEEYAQVQRP